MANSDSDTTPLLRQWQQYTTASPFSHELGMEVRRAQADACVISVPYRDSLVGNPATGVLHSGVITTLLDSCSGLAIFARLNRMRAMATLDLRGRAAGTALLEISGALNPTASPLALDIRAKATDLELAPFSPYAGHSRARGARRRALLQAHERTRLRSRQRVPRHARRPDRHVGGDFHVHRHAGLFREQAMTALAEVLAAARAGGDWNALVAWVPYAKFMGLRIDVDADQFRCTLPFTNTLIGNPRLPALHGGAVSSLTPEGQRLNAPSASTDSSASRLAATSSEQIRTIRQFNAILEPFMLLLPRGPAG